MRPCASYPIDSTIRAQGPRWKSIAAPFVGGGTGWSDGLLHAVHSRVRLSRRPERDPPPPVAAPRDALAALDRRKFRPRPPKRCAPRRDPCPPPNIASSNVAFPQMSPAPKCCPCSLPGVVYTPLDAVHAPFQAPHVSSLCDWLSKCVGFIGNPAPYASFGFSLSGVLRSRSALYIAPVR